MDQDSILIIPDVHGRKFWKWAVEKYPEVETIFLGDYHDPYPYEGITNVESLRNFKEIIEYVKCHPNCKLLVGNHDLHYLIDIEGCRKDFGNEAIVRKLLFDNLDLFDIAELRVIKGKKYLFSHAPILMEWIREVGETENVELLVNRLNRSFHDIENNEEDMQKLLDRVSRYRGGWNTWGSPIWSDLYEIYENGGTLIETADYSIFGHSQLKRPLITKECACLDTHDAYLLNPNGEIKPI